MTEKAIKRFWAKVAKSEGCWQWTAHTCGGYGYFRLDGHNLRAHRISHELCIGPIPDSYEVDHLCRNRRCVNPAHLEAVTRLVNLRRKPKLHIFRCGHLVTPETTVMQRGPCGLVRRCRTCRNKHKRTSAQRVYARKKETAR